MTIQKCGWVLTAGLAGAIFGTGFQNKAEKIGVVDVAQIFQTSDLTGRKKEELRLMGENRKGILDFVHTYRTFTPSQAERYKALSLKPSLAPAEKTELDKIKADVIAQDKVHKALQTKAKPTPDEVTRLNALSEQTKQTQVAEQTWAKEFDDAMNAKQDSLRQEVLETIQGTVQEVGKKQGYSLIFLRDVAPFAANDVTPEVLKVINAKK